jgi:hypothetical protein
MESCEGVENDMLCRLNCGCTPTKQEIIAEKKAEDEEVKTEEKPTEEKTTEEKSTEEKTTEEKVLEVDDTKAEDSSEKSVTEEQTQAFTNDDLTTQKIPEVVPATEKTKIESNTESQPSEIAVLIDSHSNDDEP